MNLFNSEIITSKHDALWADVSELVEGATSKPVLVVTNKVPPGSAEEMQLKKMMEACKLSPDQYNIITLEEGRQAAWYQLRELLDPKIIFLIGVLPAQLGISSLFKINEPNNFNDRIWLPTLSLKELEKNGALKVQLWNNGMKPIFIENKSGHL